MGKDHRDQELPRAGLPIAVERLDRIADGAVGAGRSAQLILVTAGSARHTVGDDVRPAAAGYVALVAPAQEHAWAAARGLRAWTAHVGPELMARELGWFTRDVIGAGERARGCWLRSWLTPASRALAERWLAVVPPREAASPTADALRLAGICGVLGEVARHASRRAATRHGTREEALVSTAVEQMERDVGRPWTVDALAAAVHVSPSRLSRAFSATLGRGPMAHLARLRVDRVAADLLRDDAPIAEIGRRHGWADPSYLSRRFRQYIGLSPRAYRKHMAFDEAGP